LRSLSKLPGSLGHWSRTTPHAALQWCTVSSQDPRSYSYKADVDNKLGQMEWKSVARLLLHAELALLLYMQNTKPVLHCGVTGCNKHCLCCSYWLQHCNWRYNTAWWMTGSHSKPYKNWVFSMTEGDCNTFIVNSIQENLCKAFFEQVDNGPPPSDDFDSSPKSNRLTGFGSGDIVTCVDG
jgi:hypothetical protein